MRVIRVSAVVGIMFIIFDIQLQQFFFTIHAFSRTSRLFSTSFFILLRIIARRIRDYNLNTTYSFSFSENTTYIYRFCATTWNLSRIELRYIGTWISYIRINSILMAVCILITLKVTFIRVILWKRETVSLFQRNRHKKRL